MDNKRMILAMLLLLVLVMGWQAFVAWQYSIHPEWRRPGQEPPPEQVVQVPPAPATQPVEAEAPAPAAPGVPVTAPTTAPAGAIRVDAPAEVPGPVVLGSEVPGDPQYALAMKLSPRGAGVEGVVLNRYQLERETPAPYLYQTPVAGFEAQTRPLATRAVTVNGATIELADVPWRLEEATASSARFYVDLLSDGRPLLRVRKTYHVPERTGASFGYEVEVEHTFENLAGRPLEITTRLAGPTPPPVEIERGGDRYAVTGFGADGFIELVAHPAESFTAEEPLKQLHAHEDGLPMVWGGAMGAYFNAIVLPTPVEGAAVQPKLAAFEARALNPQADPLARTFATEFETAPFTLPAGQTAALGLDVYFGPKQRGILHTDYYEAYPRGYNVTLKPQTSCAFCTFDWLVNVLMGLLDGFHFVLRDWGLAIIGLVLLVRLILHPVTKRSQVNIFKMQKLAPEMERIKKKYGDDPQEMQRQMMAFYKEHGASQVLGCLPMFLQMPIWIALYSALQSTFELRHAPFLYGLTWIDDLSKPDHLVEWPTVNFLFLSISGLNVLPILMGVVFYLQQKYTPKPPAATPEQAQQQKMMMVMSVVLFPLILYSAPSGLNLYIFTSTLFGIIESKRIRDHIKEREEAEKAGKVFVEARPTRARRLGKGEEPAAGEKKGGMGGWFAELQRRAEQVQREVEKGKKKK